MNARVEYAPMLRAFVWAMAVHVLVVLLMFLGTLNWQPFRQPQATGMTIEAVMVDTSDIRERREQAQKAAETAQQKKQAQERRKQELAEQKQREQEVEEQKKIEEKQQRELDIQREKVQQEQKRIEAEAEAKRKKEAQDKLKALRVKREQEMQEQKEAQQRELEKAKEKAAEAEKQRKTEAEKMKQIEARKQAEAAEQKAKAEDLAKQKEKEAAAKAFKAGEAATLEGDYSNAIQQVVTENWLRPPTAQPGLRCHLKIVQIPGGEVISAAISGECNADEATRRSVVAAVERIEALPYRGFEKVFKREIEFIFIYDGE
jgi:colicin import membrane protein